jgi:transglutaminase-like putative cysteine protease
LSAKREYQTAKGSKGPYENLTVADIRSGKRGWRRWWGLALLLAALEIAVLSVEQARWITPQPMLSVVLVLAVAVAGLLVWSRLPGILAHFLALAAGLLVTGWQAINLLPAAEGMSRFTHLFNLLGSIGRSSANLSAGEETIGFAVFITFLVWITGYISTWSLLRRQNAWVGVCLGAAVVLVNLSNLPSRYYFFFIIYFFVAALLVAQTRIFRQSPDSERASFPRKFWVYLTASMLCVVVIAGTLSWVVPQARAPGLQTAIATGTLWKKDIVGSSLNIFNSVPSKQPSSKTSSLNNLTLGEIWHQGDQVDFTVDSPQPSYWQVQTYDIYDSGTWSNGPVTDQVLGKDAPYSGYDKASGRETLTYTVGTNINSDILLNGGSFVSSDTASILHISNGEVVGVAAPRVLAPGEHYTVTATIAETTPQTLAAAGEDYPTSVLNTYLQLPPGFSEKVKQLSANITAGAASPYQKVIAIYNYLSKMPYSTQIKAAPAGTDPVEYFLFTQKSGFCVYFASAMSVMLRSVGVPARLAAGYLPGEPGDRTGEYILLDRSYHAWSQVYFPGYGWVDVEATPASSQSPGSEVNTETPWVSGEIISQSPLYNPWQDIWEHQSPYAPDRITPAGKQDLPNPLRGPVPFADALGKALIIIIGGSLLALLLASPFMLFRRSYSRWLWRVDRSALASMVYARMCNLGAGLGMGPQPQQTPMEYATRMAVAFPQEAEYFKHVARAYTENRFGRRGRLGLFEEAELLKARCHIYETLLSHPGNRRRLFPSR